MSPHDRRATVVARASGLAHRNTYPQDRQCAERLDVHRSTPNRWSLGDPANPMNKWSRYVLKAERPWALAAHVGAMAKWKALVSRKLNERELIAHYWELLEKQEQIKHKDRVFQMQPGHSWPERAASRERVAASEMEVASVMWELEEKKVTEQQAREWAPAS